MKLIASLSNASVVGNVGGEIRMEFSSRDSKDLDSQGFWQKGPGTDFLAIYTLPNMDTITLNLCVMTNPSPGQIYLQGEIAIATVAGGCAGGLLNGLVAPPPFSVGKPRIEIQRGRGPAHKSGIDCDLGLDLAYFWDGAIGHCLGTWWAKWMPVPAAPPSIPSVRVQ